MKIEKAVVLVTGANRGLGLAYVEALLKHGAKKVYAGVRRLETADDVVELDAERVVAIQLDVTNKNQVANAAAEHQDVTLVINNAGVLMNYGGFVSHPDNAAIRGEMEINYYGTLAMCQEFAPVLKRNRGGAIVNVLSILGSVATAAVGSYCASKFAALALTRCIRAELAAQGTLVISAMPGTIDTDLAKDYPGPKVSPLEVAEATIAALESGEEEIFIGEQAQTLAAQLLADPAGLARERAAMLPAV